MTAEHKSKMPEERIGEAYESLLFDTFPYKRGVGGYFVLRHAIETEYNEFAVSTWKGLETYDDFGLPTETQSDQVEDLLFSHAVARILRSVPSAVYDNTISLEMERTDA